ncbi:hypothetical protein CC2G_007409 [Coprinopsis cinerea AmutBmut pab1-1]|nr:hypothetical protein CC2G_007409 [Coprinopsis cinerea AmutBmut pab1-1]
MVNARESNAWDRRGCAVTWTMVHIARCDACQRCLLSYSHHLPGPVTNGTPLCYRLPKELATPFGPVQYGLQRVRRRDDVGQGLMNFPLVECACDQRRWVQRHPEIFALN